MLPFPFQPTDITVEIPRQFRKWFSSRTKSVTLSGDLATIHEGPCYRIQPVAADDGDKSEAKRYYAVVRPGGPPALSVIGEFNRHLVRRTLNHRFMCEVNLIRAAVFSSHFPAPMAYVLGDYSLVHPGDCFDQHPDVVTLKALYNVKDEDARCCVCKGPFT